MQLVISFVFILICALACVSKWSTKETYVHWKEITRLILVSSLSILLLVETSRNDTKKQLSVIQERINQQDKMLATILNILQATHTNIPISSVWSDYKIGVKIEE